MRPDMEENQRVVMGAMDALIELLEAQELGAELSTRTIAPLFRVVADATAKVLGGPNPRFGAMNDRQ